MNEAGTILSGGPISLEYENEVKAVLLLPDMPLPADLAGKVGGVSIDLDLRQLMVDAQDKSAPVVLDVSPTAIRWYSRIESSGDVRVLLATTTPQPAPERIPILEASLDVLGLKIGMPQADAEKTLAGQLKIGRVLEYQGQPSADPRVVPENARLYVSEDGSDYIAVLYGPALLEQRVVGVARTLHMPDGTANGAQLLAALRKKYGQENGDWAWGRSADLSACSSGFGPSSIDWRGAAVLSGPAVSMSGLSASMASDAAMVREALISRRLLGLAWDINLPPYGAEQVCGPVLRAEQGRFTAGFAGERIPGANTLILKTRLIDNTAHRKTLEKGQQAIKNAPIDDNSGSTANIPL